MGVINPKMSNKNTNVSEPTVAITVETESAIIDKTDEVSETDPIQSEPIVNNTSSDIPRFQYNDQYTNSQSDRWLTDASYLAFQSFTVGYTVPRSLTSKIKLDNMRFYVTGENLALWSARKGLDPRYSFEGSAYVNVYSPARNISGGLHITF